MTLILALQNVITFGVNLADNIMLGAYSETALSGAAMSNQVQFLLQMITNGIAAGMIVIASQYWGKRDTASVKKIFAVAFWLSLALSAVLTLCSFFAPRGVLGLLTNEKQVIDEGVKYLKIICLSYGFFAVTNVLLGVMRSVETVSIAFRVSLIALFVNVGLNYCLIFGKFGFPELGSAGAALATLISRAVELIIVLLYVKFRDKKLRLALRDIFAVKRIFIGDFIKTGLPTVLSSTSWGVAMAIQGAIIGRLGASAIAASSIATTIFQVVLVVAAGSANSACVLTAKTIGTGDIERVKRYAKTLQVLFVIIGVLTGLTLFAAKDTTIGFYRVSEETARLANQFILVLCVTIVGTSYQMPSLTGIVSGGGETKFVLFNDLIFMWGIVLPLSALFAFVVKLPVVAVFACLKSDQVLKCAVAVVKVNRFRWIRHLTRSSDETPVSS